MIAGKCNSQDELAWARGSKIHGRYHQLERDEFHNRQILNPCFDTGGE